MATSQNPTPQNPSSLTRRTFLNAAAAGVGSVALGAAATRKVIAQPASANPLGANERIRMGIIGTGGMGRHHMQVFKDQGVEWAAACDVYGPNLDEALKVAGPDAKGYKEHERILERKDIDAVLIASPEHWHHGHLLAALAAGKDVYCEKPMSWSIKQGQEMVDAVAKSDRIVQVGMQRRSAPAIRDMKKLFEEKALGKINMVQAEWFWIYLIDADPKIERDKLDWERFCGPAGKQEYDALKYRRWRFFWPFSGGNVTDQGTHLMDVVQWMMGVDKPIAAQQGGAVYANKPTETPDHFCCTFEYPDFVCTWTLGYNTNKWRNGWSIVFHGDKGSLFLTEDGWRLFDGVNGWEKGMPKPAKEHLPGGQTSTVPHTKNFLDCIKSRKQPNATVEIGHKAVRTLHLANAALHAKKRAELADDGATVKA